MTREEANHYLKSSGFSDEQIDTIAKAYTEPCEDAISRQAVLDALEWKWAGKAAIDAIKELPPVTPQPKIGHWIVDEDCEGKTRRCVCDRCGYSTDKYTWKNPNFCAECGAKMESEE